MRHLRWLTLLWPGLPQLWFAGAFSGLAMAAGAALILNLELVASLVWTELFAAEVRWIIAGGIGVVWLAAAAVSWRWIAGLRLGDMPQAADGDLLNLARGEYLKGNWYEAEAALGRLLDRNLLDVEARLMLASLLGHAGRRPEAVAQLDRLSRMDGAEKWEMEIERLRRRLAAADSTDAEDSLAAGDASSGESAAPAANVSHAA